MRYENFVFDSGRWDGFEFRDDDILICTPAKCGTTWMQTICALLIFGRPDFPGSLDLISPWLDMLLRDRDSVVADLDAQSHRRFIKTHTPLDGLPWDDRVTYICVARDPRDVAMSWDNHMANMDLEVFLARRAAVVGPEEPQEGASVEPPPPPPASAAERFRVWVDLPAEAGASLASTLGHLQTYWDARDRPNVVLVRYEDLKADLGGEMQRLARRLGISVPEQNWPALVAEATFDRMRARAAELAPNATAQLWHDNGQFFHRGSSGQWRDVVDDAEMAHYQARVAELASPELAAWLHERQSGVLSTSGSTNT